MAVFDASQGKILLRVVYDGPGFAGKTTNLERLHGFFTAARRSELFDAGREDGRTRYFEWMHLDGGLVQGHGLRCQFLTVPGQPELVARRFRLLDAVDAVVFVCDSTSSALDEGRTMFRALRARLEALDASSTPLVLQANKQDRDGALEPEELARALGVPEGTPVVGARASEGVGVRETAVLAIRAAANRVQRLVIERGINALHGEAETAESLLAALKQLQQVEHAVVVAVDGPDEACSTDFAGSSPECGEPDTDNVEDPPEHGEPRTVDDEASPETVREQRSTHGQSAQVPSTPAPPYPGPDAPSGFIWPAATGRDILRRVASAGAPVERRDLVGQVGLGSGSGASDLHIFEAGLWCLKTSGRRRFEEVDAARTALLRLARKKVMLGELMPRHTVLTLQPDGAGQLWLWTVCPWIGTLRSAMEHAAVRRDAATLGEALSAFAHAAVESMLQASRRGLVLDVHPSNFATVAGQAVYLDDDIGDGEQIPTIGHALLQRVLEYGHLPEAVDAYLATLKGEVEQRLSPGDVERLDLRHIVELVPPRSRGQDAAQRRLLWSLEHCRGSG